MTGDGAYHRRVISHDLHALGFDAPDLDALVNSAAEAGAVGVEDGDDFGQVFRTGRHRSHSCGAVASVRMLLAHDDPPCPASRLSSVWSRPIAPPPMMTTVSPGFTPL